VHTGYDTLYIVRALTGDDPGMVSSQPLWHPPHKVAAEYVSRWLAWNEQACMVASAPARAVQLA
jgi:hypothetical protein